ncbi:MULTISPECIES: lipopolysaccharide heptosyltransferase II [unclassified Polynucleobacter]|uniref:lipopolysaccharide heptosyltransferase II n=1 Tax=unclassified Polynucleobacter TaxID=2640945 RepID=UPI002572A3DA|nr:MULTISPECIES: lipopolysaccharide heptosyltransferase II [unclassified Polynucleobacter]BEI43355.1 lipopolysaccharide heptosyltransferase II [Polynucleobacter sp. HIN10]BEI45131.1 lipopolysaccharide heptosyltransferase II [Polynucleobacter sp. HIN11]
MSRILVIAPHWIGDAVMSLPLITLIHTKFPNSSIDVLCTPWVGPIYRACPAIETIVERDFQHGALQWSLRRSTARELKKQAYDVAFVLPNSMKSALIPWLAGIPTRIGYQGEFRFGLINVSLPNPSRQARTPMMEHYAKLLGGAPNQTSNPQNLPLPKLSIDSTLTQWARGRIEEIGGVPLYVFAPGAEYGSAKRWPTSHFAQLANQILEDNPDARIIILGSRADHVLGQEIVQSTNLSDRIHNWCGAIPLDQSMALIAQSTCLISNDSGLMHIGAALSIPQIAIFGSSNPKHTPPLSPKAQIIWLELDCSPCYQRTCPLGHLNCLNQIDSQRVYSMLTPIKVQ